MAQVYWCARNLDTTFGFSGNHHFLVIRLDEGESFPPFTSESESGTDFITLAAFNEDGNLQFGDNNKADVTAVREFLNPGKFKANWTDFDLEYKYIPPPKGMSDEKFAHLVAMLASRYNENQKRTSIRYALDAENCAAWINTMLWVAGIPDDQREELGEFSGVDWGEEFMIEPEMFS